MVKNAELVTVKKPESHAAEAYRILRSNVLFSSFDKKVKTIMVTSSRPEEGKSITAANLAVTMCESGNKVIIIDCDLRRSNLHKKFEVSNINGLSNFLAGICDFEHTVQNTGIHNLDILTAGVKPPNPSELLQSNKMKEFVGVLKKVYDFIIIDTPPITMVTDAQIISQYADGVILVVAINQVEKETILKAKELLEKVNAKILGIVLNKVEMKDNKEKNYYHSTDKRRAKKIKLKKDNKQNSENT